MKKKQKLIHITELTCEDVEVFYRIRFVRHKRNSCQQNEKRIFYSL